MREISMHLDLQRANKRKNLTIIDDDGDGNPHEQASSLFIAFVWI